MAKRNLVEAINLGLREEMNGNPTVVILGEDVGREGGVFRGDRRTAGKVRADRVIDTPLAESGIVGTAFGHGDQRLESRLLRFNLRDFCPRLWIKSCPIS